MVLTFTAPLRECPSLWSDEQWDTADTVVEHRLPVWVELLEQADFLEVSPVLCIVAAKTTQKPAITTYRKAHVWKAHVCGSRVRGLLLVIAANVLSSVVRDSFPQVRLDALHRLSTSALRRVAINTPDQAHEHKKLDHFHQPRPGTCDRCDQTSKNDSTLQEFRAMASKQTIKMGFHQYEYVADGNGLTDIKTIKTISITISITTSSTTSSSGLKFKGISHLVHSSSPLHGPNRYNYRGQQRAR